MTGVTRRGRSPEGPAEDRRTRKPLALWDRIKILRGTPATQASGASDASAPDDGGPGTVVRVDKRGVVVACGDGAVRFDQLQPTGKSRMDGAAFVNGYRPTVGERFGHAD
jgi:methionyl-tRNA formyltransferase